MALYRPSETAVSQSHRHCQPRSCGSGSYECGGDDENDLFDGCSSCDCGRLFRRPRLLVILVSLVMVGCESEAARKKRENDRLNEEGMRKVHEAAENIKAASDRLTPPEKKPVPVRVVD